VTTSRQIKAGLRGVDKVSRWLGSQHGAVLKAKNTALRKVGYKLKGRLQQEIRQGAPGGRKLAGLSDIARKYSQSTWITGGTTRRTNPNRSPLARLAEGVRYDVNPRPPYAVAFGWVGPTTWADADLRRGFVGSRSNQHSAAKTYKSALNPLGRGVSRGGISSRKWRWLAAEHQAGFTKQITPAQRRWIINRGADLVRRMDPDDMQYINTPFFLKRTTTNFTTPPRPIIDPFWRVHERQAWAEVQHYFSEKLKGRWI